MALEEKMKLTTRIDLTKLTPTERARVERALIPPRDTVFSRHFPQSSIEAWKRAAKEKGENMTDWTQRILDEAARDGR
jgi:hypothetical protein